MARIEDEILATANYYAPDVYTNIQFYNNLEVGLDPVSLDFLPLSYVIPNPKVFVIGLIPPSSVVSGSLLDRSATIASQGSLPTETVYVDNPAPREDGSGNARTELPDGSTTTTSNDFWDRFVAMSNRLKVQPDQLARSINFESGFNPKAYNGAGGAKGLNQLTKDSGRRTFFKKHGLKPSPENEAKFQEFWDNYTNLSREEQLPYVEAYFQGWLSPGMTAAQIEARNFGDGNARINKNGSLYDSSVPNQKKAYEVNSIFDKDKKGYITYDDVAKAIAAKPLPKNILDNIYAAQQRLGSKSSGPSTIIREPVPDNDSKWQSVGTKNAHESAKDQARVANTGYNSSTELGKSLLMSQLAEIRATQKAIQEMAQTPPLKMLVNPESFSVSDEKIISDGGWTRNGPIVEHWGPGQGKLEASGKLAAFFSQDSTRWEAPGMTRTARQYSASYQNFLSLYLLYRNNGGLYISGDSITGDAAKTRLSMVGSVYIYYDGVMYIGSFDDFSMTETDTAPFTLEYRYTFTIRARFRLDRPDSFTEAQSNPNLNTSSTSPVSFSPNNDALQRSAAKLADDLASQPTSTLGVTNNQVNGSSIGGNGTGGSNTGSGIG